LASEISKGSIGYLVVRGLSGALSLVTLILLTRVLGSTEYGRYTYILSVISMVVTFSQLGLPTLILRETARAQDTHQWEVVRGLWRWSLRNTVFWAGVMSTGLYLVTIWRTDGESDPDRVTLPLVAMLVPPVMVALNNRVAILRGLRYVIAASFLQRSMSLLAVTIGIAAATFLLGKQNPDAELAISLELAGFLAALGLAISYQQVRGAPLVQRSERLVFRRRYWISAAVPLGLIVGLRTINTNIDVIFLGWFVSADEVGVYKIAVRMATMVLLGQETVIMVMSAHFAALHAQKDTGLLEVLTRKAARWSVLVAALVLLMFVVLGRWLLGLVFGLEFEAAYFPLLILATASTCSVSLGLASTLLNMTGHEKRTAKGAAIATAVNVFLNLMLIPVLGMIGASIATAVSLLVWNIYLWSSVRSLISINTSIF
jgi:O-antigen/teichoic acid export membrane protein